MSAHISELLERCRQAGVTLRAGDNDRIKVKPVQALTPDLAEAIKANREALLQRLRAPVHAEAATRPAQTEALDCMRCAHIQMRFEVHDGTRRRFFWRCGKNHRQLEIGYGGERVIVAPEECTSWTPPEAQP